MRAPEYTEPATTGRRWQQLLRLARHSAAVLSSRPRSLTLPSSRARPVLEGLRIRMYFPYFNCKNLLFQFNDDNEEEI